VIISNIYRHLRHAGQLLRAAKAVPPFQIRGADAFVTYHALMVLWVYGMMLRDTARRTGTNTPVRGNNKGQLPTRLALQSTAEANVFLDDALNNPQMESYAIQQVCSIWEANCSRTTALGKVEAACLQ
jgi:hypothetical protein